MNAMKKVYNIIMILIIITVLILCLGTLGAIDVTSETGAIIVSLSGIILTASIFFSRNANIVANRKNNGIAWGVTAILLIFVILETLPLLIKDFTLSENVELIISVIMIALAVIILIFEIPQANSFHGAFQKFIILLVLITCGLGYSYYDKYKKAQENLFETYDYNQYLEDVEDLENISNFFQVSIYITVGAFLINPILRVHYLDVDYSNIDEIDEILYKQTGYQNASTPNPNAVLNQTKPVVNNGLPNVVPTQQIQPSQQAQPQTIGAIPIQNVPTEKVVNPNFKQDDLPEAVIPSLNFDENQEEQPVAVEQPTPVTQPETTQPTPADQPAIQPVVDQNNNQ